MNSFYRIYVKELNPITIEEKNARHYFIEKACKGIILPPVYSFNKPLESKTLEQY